ncbi:MAG: hypothetical protein ABRQ39_25565 [Candidatus Eremiobacterota bacterium]
MWLFFTRIVSVPLPVPTEIAEAIQEAKIDEIDPYIMWYYFRSGLEEYIEEPKPADLTDEDMLKEIGISAQADTTMITGSGAPVYTINDPNVLMIGPAAFENRWNRKQLFYGLEEDFTRKKFKTTVKGIMNYQVKNLKYPDGTSCTIKDPENSDTDLSAQVEFTEPTYQEGEFKYLVTCKIRPGSPASYLNPFPEDFEHLDDYDVIFVRGHGNSESIMTCPYYDDGDDNPYNSSLEKWLTNNKGKYCIGHAFFSPVYDFAGFEPSEKEALYYKIITLKREFFANQDFEGKLLYFNICEGKLYCYGYNISHTPYGPVITWDYNDETFKNAQVLITPTLTDGFNVDDELAYKFFSYMLGIDPTDPNRKKIQAKSAVDAYWTVINQSDLKLQALVQMGYGTQIYTQDGKYNNTYLANEPTIEVTKTKK